MKKKDRRHSGYVTPFATVSKKELIKNDLFLNPFYDDWNDYRDGLRDWFRDFKTIKNINFGVKPFNDDMYKKRIQMNKKQKILARRRKSRRCKYRMILLG